MLPGPLWAFIWPEEQSLQILGGVGVEIRGDRVFTLRCLWGEHGVSRQPLPVAAVPGGVAVDFVVRAGLALADRR